MSKDEFVKLINGILKKYGFVKMEDEMELI